MAWTWANVRALVTKSKVNAALLATQAHAELKEAHPEQFKIFLLAFGAGLRRSEIDRLTWKHFDWHQERGKKR